ncbi:MAG TPA: AIR synthase-related protein [Candidatus Saccharimonadales bacterium]|nr:AIR synthase-related protein [Candidatus Saccharimonadales bacterium]
MVKKLSYHKSVNYSIADPAKVLAQKLGAQTSGNMPFGFKEVPGIRGESAYVFDMGDMYGALVQEGLGTKSLIAQSIYEETGKSHFAAIAQDTVATFINDLISVGATPVASNAYWSSSSYDWLNDKRVTEDFINGWKTACDEAQIVWGGGETQALKGIISDGSLELAGCAFGVIKPKSELVDESKLKAGDAIVLLESSGVHANGISLTREIAKKLDDGYSTRLPSGTTYGEALLVPTHLYAKPIRRMFDEGLDVHYLSNITGHGWRKIMRATADYTYTVDNPPPVQEVFGFIARQSGNDEQEMYGNYNMGAGYAVYLPEKDAKKAVEISNTCGIKARIAGRVEKGPKQLKIVHKNITFAGRSLSVR